MLEPFGNACRAIASCIQTACIALTPSNILLFSVRGTHAAVISDLGIGSNEDEQGQLTATHESIGTPIYRAPEVAHGRHTKTSDVYSLGRRWNMCCHVKCLRHWPWSVLS